MAYTYSKIATYTVGATSVPSVSFLNIPQNYTDLVVKISMRGNNSTVYAALTLQFNGDTGNNYSRKYLESDAATAYSGGTVNGANINLGNFNGSTATANSFGVGEIYIPNYTSSNYKSVSVETANESNVTTVYLDMVGGLWNSTSPITSIQLNLNSTNNAVQYSTFHLYGIKAEL